MKPWVTEKIADWAHTIKVYFVWIKKQWLVHTEYRANAFVSALGSVFWILVSLLTYNLIFAKITSLAGWSWQEMILLYGVYNLWWGLATGFFTGGLKISRKVRVEGLDKNLLWPGSPFFYVSMKFEPELLIHSATGIIIFFIALGKLSLAFNVYQWLLFLALLFNSLALIFFVSVIFGATAFWITENEQLVDCFWSFEGMARYPREIFAGSKILYGIVFTVLPIIFMAAVPAEVILGRSNIYLILWSFAISIIFGFLARTIWRAGLKHYNGVSV